MVREKKDVRLFIQSRYRTASVARTLSARLRSESLWLMKEVSENCHFHFHLEIIIKIFVLVIINWCDWSGGKCDGSSAARLELPAGGEAARHQPVESRAAGGGRHLSSIALRIQL